MCGEHLFDVDKSKHASFLFYFLHIYKQIAIVRHVYFLFFTCVRLRASVINWKVFKFYKMHFEVKARGSKMKIDVHPTSGLIIYMYIKV